jgi:enoyl-CoA hydratase/carnithine racemase
METLSYEKEGPVGRVTLNRPECLNAQNFEAVTELEALTRVMASDSELRVVTIQGAGRSFCTGIDLKELFSDNFNPQYFKVWEEALRNIETSRFMSICLLRGYCLGGGLQLALACDIRVATAMVQIGLPAVLEGLIPGLAIRRLPEHVGIGRAKQMILSGDTMTGEEAKSIGLVDHICTGSPEIDLRSIYTQKYLASCSMGSRLAKQLVNQAKYSADWQETLNDYLALQDTALHSNDFREAKISYLTKRDPVWS